MASDVRINVSVNGLNKINKALTQAGKSAKGLNFNIANIAKGIVGYRLVTAAIQGLTKVVTDSFTNALKFSEAMDKVAAVSKASEVEIKALTEQARLLGLTTSKTATEVAGLQLVLARVGFDAQQIEESTAAIINLSIATGEDLAKSADVASATLKGFGLEAEEMDRVVNVMTAGFNSSALQLSNFQQAMKTVAPVANAANVDLETTTALLATLADAGIRGSKAATGLKNIIADMSDPTSALAQELNFAVSGSESLMEGFQVLADSGIDLEKAISLVDKRSRPAFLALLDGVKNSEDLVGSFQNVTNEAAITANVMEDNLAGDVRALNSAWESLTTTIGESTPWRTAVRGLTEILRRFQGDSVTTKVDELRVSVQSLVTPFQDTTEHIALVRKEFNEMNRDLGKAEAQLAKVQEEIANTNDGYGTIELSNQELELQREINARKELIEELTPVYNRANKALKANLKEEIEKQEKTTQAIADAQKKAVKVAKETQVKLAELNAKTFEERRKSLKDVAAIETREAGKDLAKRKLIAAQLKIDLEALKLEEQVFNKEHQIKLLEFEVNTTDEIAVQNQARLDIITRTYELELLQAEGNEKKIKEAENNKKEATLDFQKEKRQQARESERELRDAGLKETDNIITQYELQRRAIQDNSEDRIREAKGDANIIAAIEANTTAELIALDNELAEVRRQSAIDRQDLEAQTANLRQRTALGQIKNVKRRQIEELKLDKNNTLSGIDFEIGENERLIGQLTKQRELLTGKAKVENENLITDLMQDNEALSNFRIANSEAADQQIAKTTQELNGETAQMAVDAAIKVAEEVIAIMDRAADRRLQKEIETLEAKNQLEIDAMDELERERSLRDKRQFEDGQLQAKRANEDQIRAIKQQAKDGFISQEQADQQILDLRRSFEDQQIAARRAQQDKELQERAEHERKITAILAQEEEIRKQLAEDTDAGKKLRQRILGGLKIAGAATIAVVSGGSLAVPAAALAASGATDIAGTFANGGIVQGRSHSQGGEKFAVGGRVVELEGGEGVINKRSMSNPFIRSAASRLNQAGGGKKFAHGGIIPKYAGGGILEGFGSPMFEALKGAFSEGVTGLRVYNTVTDTTDRQNDVENTIAESTI